MRLDAGALVGPYEIVGVLGEGGMGVVYRAHDARLQRDVAIKFVSSTDAADKAWQRQVQQEARAASKLNHPNIVAVFDVGTHDDVMYVVTELLEGESLSAVCERGPTPWRAALGIAVQIAEGLAAAHEQGIVHRDIKPDNLFVTQEGRIKVLDFGVATRREAKEGDGAIGDAETVSQMGLLVGTVGYMSPEQTRGQKVDQRTDLFAFGCVLYELLSGKRAFDGNSPVDVLAAIQRDTPPALDELVTDVRPDLARIVERCLEKDPNKRFQSARDLLFALTLVQTGRAPTEQTRPAKVASPPAAVSRRALLAMGGALVATAAASSEITRALLPTPPAPTPIAPKAVALPSLMFRQVTFQRGTVYTARFTHDGSAIVYSAAWEGQKRDLFVSTPGTREARSLAQPDTDVAFILSTGEANVIRRSNGGFSAGTLARLSLAGGPAKDLVEGVKWADGQPDGSQLLLIRRVDGQSVLELDGNALSKGKPMAYPRASPDAQHAAFLEFPIVGQEWGRLVIVDRKGTRVHESEIYNNIEGLAWRSNQEVWFTAAKDDRALYMNATTLDGQTRVLARAPGRLVLHDLYSDGRVVAERNSYRCNLRSMLEGKDETDIGWQDFSQLGQISRDGKQMLFNESGAGTKLAVYLRPLSGGPPLRLGEGLALALSDDATRALVRVGETDVRLEVIPVGAGHSTPLQKGSIAGVSWAAFVPKKAERIVMLANESAKGERVFVQELTGEPRAITGEGVTVAGDALSFDGKRLAATVNGKPAIVTIEDGTVHELPGLGTDHQPIAWTADGKTLFVRTSAALPISLFRYDLASSKLTPWRTLRPQDLAGVLELGRVGIARDGAVLVYESYQLLSDLFVIENIR